MDLLAAAYASDTDEDEPCDDVEPTNTQPRKRLKAEPPQQQQQHTTHTTALPSAEAMLSDLLAPATATTSTSSRTPADSTLSLGPLQLPPEPACVRNFPHVEGNFATVVYITVDEPARAKLHALTTTLLSACVAATSGAAVANASATGAAGVQLWPTFPWSQGAAASTTAIAGASAAAAQGQAGATNSPSAPAPAPNGNVPTEQQQQQQQLPLHMSISRTVPIRRIQIESLQAALSKQLKPFKAARVQLQGLLCLANDARSRSFVGVRVAPPGQQQVVRLIQAVNRAFITHGLQPFYEDPLPHVSLAWTPGEQVPRLQPWLDSMKHEPTDLKVCQVVCQTGKVRTVVWQAP